VKANHLGELDMTPQPAPEPRISVGWLVILALVLVPALPVAKWLLIQGLELARIAEAP
jgi:hypothetical protein